MKVWNTARLDRSEMNTQGIFKILAVIVTLGYAKSQVLVEKVLPDAAKNVFPSYQPFEFSYQSNDGSGTTQHRQESGDTAGIVKGAYGYTDPQGMYRTVEYVADDDGFRAVVKSNEPGTANQNSADAVFAVQSPPAGLSAEAVKRESQAGQVVASSSSTVPITIQAEAPRAFFPSYPIAVRPAVVPYPYPLYRTPMLQAASSPLRYIVRESPFTPRGRTSKLLSAL